MGNAELRVTLQKIDDKVNDVLTQATKTNGSVAKATIEIEHLKRWRTGLTYAYLVLMVVILPILGFTLLRVWNTPPLTASQIKQASQQGVIQGIEQLQVKTLP